MAQNPYNSPGVTVTESITPSVSPALASPQIVAVVGPASGVQTASERLLLTGTTPVTLKYTGVITGAGRAISATNAYTGVGVSNGAYVVAQSSDPNASVVGDEIYTVARLAQPSAAPTVSAAGTGSITGTYVYAYTYVNASGETGQSPTSNAVSPTAAGNNLTGITVGPSGTTGRNVYRMKTSVGGDSKWHLVATLADNTTTTLTNETTTDTVAQGDQVTTFGTQLAPQGIADGDTIILSYTYTNNNYYQPTSFNDYDDVVAKYGTAFDANGNINSPLTFAARLVFLNGASDIVTVASATSSQVDIDAATALLENSREVRIVVTTGGTASSATSLAAHVTKMSGQGYYRIGVAGLDGSTTNITPATIRTAASALNNEAVRLVNASSYFLLNPTTGRKLNVGSQYVAAALAGMYAGRDVQIPLTRKTVAGFDGVNDVRTASDLALDSASGLLVVENRGGIMRVRHDLTTAVGAVNTRESSVVRAKYEMASRLKDTLDSSVIGVVVPSDRAPLIVQGAVQGVLEQLISEEVINNYFQINARALADPTTIEVKFQYQPMYPINNVSVIFTINTTGSATDFQLVAS